MKNVNQGDQGSDKKLSSPGPIMLITLTTKQITEALDGLDSKKREKILAKYIQKGKEKKETANNLPSAVATQEKKALAYFEKNNESKYLKIVKHVQKLRTEGKITYEDLGGGKYNVVMLCGNKKLKMYFPADTKLSDSTYNYTDWDGSEISNKETTRDKLWSKEGEKYLSQKGKEGQNVLSKPEFKTLIQSLYPKGTEEEQILAFMLATGFYGRMWLSDKTTNYQLAVECCRRSGNRGFNEVSKGFTTNAASFTQRFCR